MYWLLCASTVWKTGFASANRVKLTEPPVAPDADAVDDAELDGASLADADVDGAALDDADVDGAALDGAALEGAALEGAALDGAALDGAALDGATGGTAVCAAVGAGVAGVDEHAPSTMATTARSTGSLLRMHFLLR